ncbi:Glutathione hydrolase proenzyme [Geodia barretti]|uniref:Glutathione hydrolase proenzyme n=1 Tax=Geodia barretti TaxID=519541 RepID=A0AA35QSM1_GEOBA|nr:Glutathione hydrolase proenzyme [Geodia barretti]
MNADSSFRHRNWARTFHWIVQSFAVALPEIQDSTGLNSVGVAGVMSAMDLTAGQFALPSGLVVDVLRCYWELLLGLFASAAVVRQTNASIHHSTRRHERQGVVTSGHYLVSSVGLQMLMRGGNAIDAAAAMGICETLLEPQSCGIGGEVPTLVYIAKERRTYAVSGMGWSPEALTIDWCRQTA